METKVRSEKGISGAVLEYINRGRIMATSDDFPRIPRQSAAILAILATGALFAVVSAPPPSLAGSQALVKAIDAGEPAVRESLAKLVSANSPHDDLGEEIVFTYNDDLWVQRADGTGRRALLTKGTDYSALGQPAWSNDGGTIAFGAMLRGDPRVVDLFLVDADGENVRSLIRLNAGYYRSTISSISWAWDDQYIMFVYGYDAQDLTTLSLVCTISKTGSGFNFAPQSDVVGAQYEPFAGSSRYAYTTLGNPLDFNSHLRVSNMSGTSVVDWYTLNAIYAYGELVWLSSTSICAVMRNINGYPNQEILVRFDRPSTTVTSSVIFQSEVSGRFGSPTFGPTKRAMYICETVDNVSTLWYSGWNQTWGGNVTVARGYGCSPDWRQRIPATAIADDKLSTKAAPLGRSSLRADGATVSYALDHGGYVLARLYTVHGKVVCTLVDGYQVAGRHSVSPASMGVRSGTYVLRVRAGAFEESLGIVVKQ
jgi:hypothetical protein